MVTTFPTLCFRSLQECLGSLEVDPLGPRRSQDPTAVSGDCEGPTDTVDRRGHEDEDPDFFVDIRDSVRGGITNPSEGQTGDGTDGPAGKRRRDFIESKRRQGFGTSPRVPPETASGVPPLERPVS